MEDIAISIIKKGGVSAVLFVLWLLSSGYFYIKYDEVQNNVVALQSESSEMRRNLTDIRVDVSFIRAKLEDKK